MFTDKGREELLRQELLRQVEESNPWYLRAVMTAASVMPSRRAKYSGDGDPFTNFTMMGRILGIDTEETFKYYVALKLARVMVTDGDYSDESYKDTLRDLANYALLWLGYIIQQEEE